MNLKIVNLPTFEKKVKKLFKKYRQLPKDLTKLQEILLNNPKAGIHIVRNCYKIRLENSSIPIGKSGGFRVIYYYIQDDKLYLMTIYSKSDLESISEKEIIEILDKFGL